MRNHEDGHTLVNNVNGIKIRVFKDCMVLGALDRQGMLALSFLSSSMDYTSNSNITVHSLDDESVHTVEIYYNKEQDDEPEDESNEIGFVFE